MRFFLQHEKLKKTHFFFSIAPSGICFDLSVFRVGESLVEVAREGVIVCHPVHPIAHQTIHSNHSHPSYSKHSLGLLI